MINADFTDIARLINQLETAPVRAHKTIGRTVLKETEALAAAARSTAASYGGTGELSGRVGTYYFDAGLTGTAATGARQGTFLSTGSPTTGGPRDWMTGPAGRAQEVLMAKLETALNPW